MTVDKITNPPSIEKVVDKVNEVIDNKQDTLTAGTDLEIVNATTPRLPAGFTELEWLQSDGACCIDLGVISYGNDEVEQKYQRPSTFESSVISWFGSMQNNAVPRFSIGVSGSSGVFAGFNFTKPLAEYDNNIHIITLKKVGSTYYAGFDDATASYAPTSASTNPSINSYLFARNSSTITYDGTGTRIFYHKQNRYDGTPLLDLVPAKRDSDNALGMYDLVSNTFLGNSGTGTFTGGPEVIYPTTTTINFTNASGYTTNEGTVTSVNNTQPDANGDVTLTIPTVNDGILTITQNGTSKGTFSANQSTNDTIALTDTTYNAFTGADGTNAGSSGLVPAPSATDNDKYLKGDGTWASVSGGSSTDVQINGTSITSGGVANILTNTAYNATSNKIATMSDLPADEIFVATYGTTTFNEVWTAYDAGKTVFVKDTTTVLGEVIAVLNYFEFNSALDAHFEFASSILNDGTYYTYTLDQDSYWNEYTEQIPDTSGLANTDLSNLTATGEAHFLKNTATGTNSLTIGGTATSVNAAVNIGYNSSVALSAGGQATRGIAIGVGANVTGTDSIQLGMGTASSNSSLYAGFYIYGNYQLLDGTTGLIPDARLSTNIARTSQIPSTSGLANTSLSNLSSTGQKVIDGQWVAKETSLTTSTAINSYTLDLVNYLPSGGGKYEVLVACNITSNNTSPSNTRLYSDIISISTNYLNQKTPNTSHSLQAGCLLILPVTRYLYFKIENHATASTTIIAEGYRRIGTNT